MKRLLCTVCAAAALYIMPAAVAAPVTSMSKAHDDFGVPVRIIIPRIQVNAPVAELGLDKNGYMEAPSDGNHLGWYGPGVKPGQVGNAVIDGHYDTETQSAIFYSLSTLQKGDEIFVVTENELVIPFTVYTISRFDAYDFPLQDVFGASSEKNLNLITCAGEYDMLRHAYLQRLVVFSRRT